SARRRSRRTCIRSSGSSPFHRSRTSTAGCWPCSRSCVPERGGQRLAPPPSLWDRYCAVQVKLLLEQLRSPESVCSTPSNWSVPLACPAGSNDPLIEPWPLKFPLSPLNVPPQFFVGSRVHGSSPNETGKSGTIPKPAAP